MARTDRFRAQHDELLKLAGELQALLVVSDLARDGSAARTCLGKLIGKLVLHITTEDKVLYPELMANKDRAVADLARRFTNEMEGTAKKVVAYNEKWITGSKIAAGAEEFVRETRQILQVLADRIRRENQELYAAADRVEGKAFA